MSLPLPLVAFERYMLADDRPHEPMAFQIRLTFTGRIEPEPFREALTQAIAQHPLLHARISGKDRHDLTWIDGGIEVWFDCQPSGTPLEHPAVASIDLRRESGLRTWVRYDEQQVEIRFHFHHSCSDGIGAYRFIDEVLCRYHNLLRPDVPVAIRPVRPELLPQRSHMGLTWLRRLLRLPLSLVAVVESPLENKFLPPRALALPTFIPPDDASLRRVIDMPAGKLSRDEVSRLAKFAKASGVSLNDLLMRDTLIALRDWNERVTGQSLNGRIGLMVPFNLRAPIDEQQTITNIVGMSPINIGAKQLNQPAKLLKFISAVMRYYKWLQVPIEFGHVLSMVERLFGSLESFLADDHCNATATFSNVGRVFSDSPLPRQDERLRAGDLLLESIESAPPIRPHTWVSFTTLSYRGEMAVIANFDRLAMSDQTAREVVECVTNQLRTTASAV
jgi:hypothetical protein